MQEKPIDYTLTLKDTNVLKGIAICAMLWHHLFLGIHEYGYLPFKIAQVGKICVAIFVFLSGYGLTLQYKKLFQENIKPSIKQAFKFICKRLVKFYMNYWFIFVITVPLGVFVFNRPLEAAYGNNASTPLSFFLDTLGFMSYNSYNVTWWFNRLILVLYAVFPLFTLAMQSKLIGFMLLTLFYWAPEILYPLELLSNGSPTYIFTFALAIFLAQNNDLINTILNKINRYALIIFAIFITVFFCIIRNHVIFLNFNGSQVDPWLTLFLCLSIVCIKNFKQFKMNPIEICGKNATNMYLTHTFICGYFFSNFIYSFKNPILIFIVLLAVSLILSIIIEFIKKKILFYKLQNSIIDKITAL